LKNNSTFAGLLLTVFVILNFSFLILNCQNCQAQTAGKYEFYRYLQSNAVQIDPLGQLLGRISGHFEMRLDPNYSRTYEIVYQRDVADKSITGWYHESAITIGAVERIYLVDNAAMLGQFAGVGAGVGFVDKNLAFRLTAEMGYKFAFGGGKGHYFIEPSLIMDAYLVTNRVGKRVLPYIAIPFGYSWW
jgi:hypothetical protein